ncbi:fibroblast growth factor-binding protein 1 [Tachysurus fulvidraco]|uniref:fibroblast growth factor-binding protein 1 n=1 Tax=Tachysurus fulvidraco TaxID=1234273 RepID=UPI000F4F32A3|nr:fibroblast growth factor-binding protein 1 [Tachysurus fulvidraco]
MMACLKAFTLILICVCILQQLLQVNTQVKKGRGKKNQYSLSPKPKALPHNPKKSSSKNPNVDAVLFKSRFVKEDGMRCTWAATESSIEDGVAFVLSITCKKGTVLHCEYTAKPRLCPEITSNIDAFWKQISRSLKNQNKLCRDTKALIRARMCRMAPKGAHFALKTPPKVLPTPASKNSSCPNLHNREKMAEEYCGSSWSSFCTFFFALVETEDC